MPYNEEEKKLLVCLGKAIRRCREERGVSQEKLAFMAGVNRTYMGSVERGERNVAVLNLVKIARALGVPVARFFEGM